MFREKEEEEKEVEEKEVEEEKEKGKKEEKVVVALKLEDKLEVACDVGGGGLKKLGGGE